MKPEIHPLTLLTSAVVVGVLCGWNGILTQCSEHIIFLCALGIAVLGALVYASKMKGEKQSIWMMVVVFVFFALVGLTRGKSARKELERSWNTAPQLMVGTIVSEPIEKEKTIRFTLQCEVPHALLMVYVQKDSTEQHKTQDLTLGKHLTLTAIIKAPKNRGNPDEFDYAKWLKVQGISGTVWCKSKDIQLLQPKALTPNWDTRMKIFFLKVRARCKILFQTIDFEEETLGIATALTLGDRSLVSSETRERFADAGASHLLALSGLHLGILVGFFLSMLNGRFHMSRWRIPLSAALFVFIWSYTMVAGMPTSLTRASTMTSIFLLGALFKRDGRGIDKLVLALLLMVLVKPVVLFDVGAQLSFLAVAGILLIHSPLDEWLKTINYRLVQKMQHYKVYGVLSLLSVSISAQIFTLPVVAYYFHQIPTYAPLFNLIYIPLTTILIYYLFFLLIATYVCGLFSLILNETCNKAVAWVPNEIVKVERVVMEKENNLPGAVIEDFWSRKAEPQLVIYNMKNPTLHIIYAPNKSVVTTTDATDAGLRAISNTFWKCRLTAAPKVVEIKAANLGNRIISIKNNHLLWVTAPEEDGNEGEMKLIILDGSISALQRKRWKKRAQQAQIPYYDIKEQGALQISLTSEP